MPPSLRPRWSSASSKELRMSLPMAATGPLNELMKPILMVFCWATVGAAAMTASAAAAQPARNRRFMTENLRSETLGTSLARRTLAAQFEALNLAGRGFRQISAKLDPTGVFVGGELRFDVVLQRPRHRVTSGGVSDFGLILQHHEGLGLHQAVAVKPGHHRD